MTDWGAVRAGFPALKNCTFLNSATYGQLHESTVAAVNRHFADRDEQACANFLSWFDDADRIRATIGEFIGAGAADIAFFQNAATAVSLLAQAIDWQPGDRILTLENEFPNHLYLAQHLAEADIVAAKDVVSQLTPRTRLVMLSTVNYSTGLRPDLEAIAAACRANGTLLSIDGTQSAGALRFDVGKVQPDLYVVDGYKWLLCPNGAGFAYVAPQVRRWLQPAVIGWRSDRRWREVNTLHQGAPEFKDDAERYEGGILPFPRSTRWGRAWSLFLKLGLDAIEERVLGLAAYAREVLRKAGARVLADEDPQYASPIVAAQFAGVEAGQLALALKQRKVLVAARHGNLRVSTHFYNNEEDIDQLGRVLKDVL